MDRRTKRAGVLKFKIDFGIRTCSISFFHTKIILLLSYPHPPEKAIYLSDVPGLLIDKDDPTSIISSVQHKELHTMFEKGVISDGMIPKVESCIHALEKGAKAAHLLDGRVSHVLLLELFTDSGIGTMIGKGGEDV